MDDQNPPQQQNLPPVQPTPESTLEPSFLKKTFTPKYLALLLAILIIGGGAYGYTSYLAKKNYEKVASEAQKAQQEIESLKEKRNVVNLSDPCPLVADAEGNIRHECLEDLKILYGQEAELLCGPQPPAQCGEGLKLGCKTDNKKWDCYADTSNWQTYRNDEYGFEFRYPREWVNLKVVSKKTDEANYLYFCSLNTVENYVERDCGITFSGYARIFYIKILTENQWAEEQTWVTGKPVFIARNEDYVFGSGVGQESAANIKLSGPELDQILSTFRFTQ